MDEIFPDIAVAREQNLLTYRGVVPLPRTVGGAIGAVSRVHVGATDMLPKTNLPVFSMIGGEWTACLLRHLSSCTQGRSIAVEAWTCARYS